MDARLGPGFTTEREGILTSSLDARPRTGPRPLPQPERTKDSSHHLLPNPVPTPCRAGPSGNAFGEPGGGFGAPGFGVREGPRGKAGPGAPGPLELLRTWERPRSGRPRGAGGGLALGPWRRGGPGLAQRRRLQEARGFGLRRRLVPRPLRRPRSVREPAALRPAPSAAQAPAPAPTSTWSPIETVRHAPALQPRPPPLRIGRAGGATGRPVTAAPHSGLMEEEAGGPCSVLRAPGPRRRAAAQCPPPRLPSAGGRSHLSPRFPRPPATQRGRGGSQRPPAARRPRARLPTSARVRLWKEGGRPRLSTPAAWTSGVGVGGPGQQAAPQTAAFRISALRVGLREKRGTLTRRLRPPR